MELYRNLLNFAKNYSTLLILQSAFVGDLTSWSRTTIIEVALFIGTKSSLHTLLCLSDMPWVYLVVAQARTHKRIYVYK